MDKKPASALTKGVVIALVLVVLSLITFFANLQEQTWIQVIGYAIFVVGIVWSVSSYGKQLNYNANFGKYFTHGFGVAAVITCLMIIFTAVYLNIDPSIKRKALEEATKKMGENPNLSKDQIDQAVQLSQKFFLPFALGGVLLGYMLIGTVISLVTSAVIKKDPRPFEENDNNSSVNPIG